MLTQLRAVLLRLAGQTSPVTTQAAQGYHREPFIESQLKKGLTVFGITLLVPLLLLGAVIFTPSTDQWGQESTTPRAIQPGDTVNINVPGDYRNYRFEPVPVVIGSDVIDWSATSLKVVHDQPRLVGKFVGVISGQVRYSFTDPKQYITFRLPDDARLIGRRLTYKLEWERSEQNGGGWVETDHSILVTDAAGVSQFQKWERIDGILISSAMVTGVIWFLALCGQF